MIENPYTIIDRRFNRIEAQQEKILELLASFTNPTPTPIAPVMSSKQVQGMTGWPNGTFYAKVAEMPEGVVIRGRSKRLMFNTAPLIAWLQAPTTKP